EAGREITIEEAGLGEGEVDLSALKTSRETKSDILALTHQVTLGDADVAYDTLARRVACAEGQLAGRLLLELDGEDNPVWAAAGISVNVDRFEKAKRAQSAPCCLDQQAIISIALCEAELAANHVVVGAEIADDVDALDIDMRAFVDHIGNVDAAGCFLPGRTPAHSCKSGTPPPCP